MKDQKITSRERVIKALTFEELDCIPIENGFDQELKERYPSDVSHVPYTYPAGKSKGVVNRKGQRIDIWGCTWEAAEDGVCGEVVASPLRDGWDNLKTFQPPWEIINGADLSGVNAACGASKNFMISMWDSMPNPFERMQHLRGTQNLFMDLGYLDKKIYLLRDMVHEYFLKQLKLWVSTDVDGIHIADDWGSQQSLLISPLLWRDFFKPLYKDYVDLAHAYGKFVLMHSDGFITDIIPDLIEIGVDAVNSQLFCMSIEELAESYAGKICFWGEIDRQRLLTSGTPQECRVAVQRVAAAFLKEKRTGIVGQCFAGKDHKRDNIIAVFDEWSKI